MIWHIAVHPDFYRQGIGQQLLVAAENRAKKLGLNRLEAWTRNDLWVQKWYKRMQFNIVDSYYHVYFEEDELHPNYKSSIPDLYLVNTFAHYVGKNIEQFKDNKRL